MAGAPSRGTGAKGDRPGPEPAFTIDVTIPAWMIEKLTAIAREQKVDPRALILQAIGDYLSTR